MATAPLQSQSFEVPQRRRISAQSIYQRLGWSVIPVDCATKGALIPWREYTARHADTMEMAEWTRRFPAAGIAVVCGAVSGLLVLDADGADGVAEARRRGLPRTPMVATPSGGLHAYFRAPAGLGFSNGAKMGESKKIDVRSDGGYVVAPNTKRPDGVRYEWIDHPGVTELAEAPTWFLGLLKARGKAVRAPLSVSMSESTWEAERESGVYLKTDNSESEIWIARLPPYVQEYIRTGQSKHTTRHQRDFIVVSALLCLGISFEELRSIFMTYPVGDKYADSGMGDRYLELTAQSAFETIKVVRVKYADLREYGSGVKGRRVHLAFEVEGESRMIRAGIYVPVQGCIEDAERWQNFFSAIKLRLPGSTKADLDGALRRMVGRRLRILISNDEARKNPIVGFHAI